jgi:hypothetical protein
MTLLESFLAVLSLAETETREDFEWGRLPEPWVIFLVVVPAVVALATLIYRRENPSGGRRSRWLLIALRAAVLLSILALLAQPMLRKVTYQTQDPRLIVLVDDSLSMSIADKFSDRDLPQRLAELLQTSPDVIETLSRYGLVARTLSQAGPGGGLNVLDRLRETMDIAVFTFAGSARKVAELPRRGKSPDAPAFGFPDYAVVQADDRVKETRVGDGVLEALLDAFGAREAADHGIVGVLLFTDGQSNAGVLQPEEMALKLRQRAIPLLAVGVGNPDPPKNIRVAQLDVDDVVLVGDQVTFDASLIADGFEGQNVQIDLLFDGEVVETEYANLEGGGKRQSARIDHRPRRPGDFTVTVQVEKLGGELFWDDNVLSRPIKVLDQKIKVLYVEGTPRWEYRYLKNALIRDPTMEAQILLLSADPKFRQESSPGVPPLAGFPGTQPELFSYHVVIIGDVDPKQQDSLGRSFSEHFDLLQRFVSESGGGVVFIAGLHANPQKYLRTPLYPLLPVELTESGFSREKERRETFNLTLTGAGREHPILRLDPDAERNLQLWENRDGIAENHLPGFYWYAPVKKPKLGGIPLAVHPRDATDDGPIPIIAIQNYSKGRVFYSGVGDTWLWRAGVDNLYFYRFWGQAIRFAASGRLLGQTPRHAIATDKRVYTIGEKVRIDAKVFDANMEPSREPLLTVYHGMRGRETEPAAKLELQLNPAREAGAYEGSMVASQLGSHDLWIGSESERLAFASFNVEVPPLEFRNPHLDRERMKKVAALCEGKYYDLHELMTAVEFLAGSARPRRIPVEEQQDDLWDEYWILLLFTGVIATEWILRKVVKLL